MCTFKGNFSKITRIPEIFPVVLSQTDSLVPENHVHLSCFYFNLQFSNFISFLIALVHQRVSACSLEPPNLFWFVCAMTFNPKQLISAKLRTTEITHLNVTQNKITRGNWCWVFSKVLLFMLVLWRDLELLFP